jgi:hypothetical protein
VTSTKAHASSSFPIKGRNLLLVVIVAVVITSVSGLVFVILSGNDSARVYSSGGHSIIPPGNTTLLPSRTAKGIEFETLGNDTVTGQFQANQTVSIYIVSDAGWNQFPLYSTPAQESCPQLCPPLFVIKGVSNGVISAELPPGRFYLVILNSNSASAALVTMIQGFNDSGMGHLCRSSGC